MCHLCSFSYFRFDLTDYEKKIGLDKHTRKKSKKHSKRTEVSLNTNPAASNQTNSDLDAERADQQEQDKCTEQRLLETQTNLDNNTCNRSSRPQGQVAVLDSEGSNCGSRNTTGCLPSHMEQKVNTTLRRDSEDELKAEPLIVTQNCGKRKTQLAHSADSVHFDSSHEEPPLKKTRVSGRDDEKDSAWSSQQCLPPAPDLWSDATRQSLARESSVSLSSWDFRVIQFPDMGGRETVLLSVPPAQLLPPNTGVDEEYEDMCMFDVEDYRRQQQLQPQSVL